MMDIKQLRAILAVHEKGSFSQAAELLGTVQSNVSAHVARLENELNAVLIDRSTMRLTPEGEAVVSRAYRAISEISAVWDDLRSLNATLAGTVRLGIIGTTARWMTPQLYTRLQKTNPSIRLIVHDGTSTTLNQLLATGRLDIGVMTLPAASQELTSSPLFTEKIALVVPRDNDPFPEADAIPMSELDNLDLLLPAPSTTFRRELEEAAANFNITLKPAAELDGIRLIASLAFDGNGLALLPISAVPAHLKDKIRLITVEGIAPRVVGLAWRLRSIPSASTKAVISLLEEITAHMEDTQTNVLTHSGK
jgi:DNA-binding transcriptional LysR family regulator